MHISLSVIPYIQAQQQLDAPQNLEQIYMLLNHEKTRKERPHSRETGSKRELDIKKVH